MGQRVLSFEGACRQYVHRYTMEHVPAWAATPAGNGRYYAPHYRTDREWYDNTLFPGEFGWHAPGTDTDCFSTKQTWPMGQWLDEPLTA
jgi:hypothetical protein